MKNCSKCKIDKEDDVFSNSQLNNRRSICADYRLKNKKHLEKQFEPWMNWKNHGIYNLRTWDDNDRSTWTWQIDHIISHNKFEYISMEDAEFKKCWSLNNLRPLSSKQNWLDGINKSR